jgi:hypothetical protein
MPTSLPPPGNPQATDRAVVVGISHYPGGFLPLQGPVLDAFDFNAWLLEPTGGGLTDDQVRLITTPFPPPGDLKTARPVEHEIQEAFDELDDLAQRNGGNGQGPRVGRRLYLYFSGHGLAPANVVRRYETAVLMANANERRLGYHIPGRGYADWFHASGFFDEVLLFMDCCREGVRTVSVRDPHFDSWPTGAWPARGFYAFGTRWLGRARERYFADLKQTRGVFTRALTAGLRGAARDPLTGAVTTSTLRDYLFRSMRTFLDPADLAAPDVPKEPDCDTVPEGLGEFVIVTFPLPRVRLRTTLTPPEDRVSLLNAEFEEINPNADPASSAAVFDVAPGRYRVQWWRGTNLVRHQNIVLESGGPSDVTV